MQVASNFYKVLYRGLADQYIRNASDQQMWNQFKKQVQNHFKMEITLDARFAQQLKEIFRDINNFKESQNYLKKLKELLKISEIAFKNRFILYRDHSKLNDHINKILTSPTVKWQEKLKLIKSASSLSQFRSDFLINYCQVEEDVIQQLGQELDSQEALTFIKKKYAQFFTKCLEESDPRISTIIQSIWASKQNRNEMLPTDLIKKLEKHLGTNVGKDMAELQINRYLTDTAQNYLYDNNMEIKERLEEEYLLIRKALEKFSGLNIMKQKNLVLRVATFGSLTSGFAGSDADLDITILTNCYVNQQEFLKVLNDFLKKEYQEGDRRSRGRRVTPDLILTAKTPLVSVKINEPGKFEMKIDIIVNNVLGVINSKFLSVYSRIKWVRNLGVLVKIWGKSVKLIDKSLLSSYSIILMLIHYLIKTKAVKPIMDARIRNPDHPHFRFKRQKQSEIQEFDVFYTFKSRREDVCNTERANYIDILIGFMKYYGQDIWRLSEELRIITVDQSLNKQYDPQTVFTIKDPFDEPHNPGRANQIQRDFIVQKFKEAHQILSKRNIDRIKELFKMQ